MANGERPKNPQETSPIRGAIKTSVSSSTENLVAGDEFSIFVTVQNPFEVPLICRRVSTYLPTEFTDVDKRLRELQAQEIEEQLTELDKARQALGLPSTEILLRKRPDKMGKFLRGIAKISFSTLGASIDFAPASRLGPAIARDVSGGEETRIDLKLPMVGELTQTFRKRSTPPMKKPRNHGDRNWTRRVKITVRLWSL
jgi:hypothetical protein